MADTIKPPELNVDVIIMEITHVSLLYSQLSLKVFHDFLAHLNLQFIQIVCLTDVIEDIRIVV